ncbi:MAG: dihydrodipicolinate reductase [Chloroflexi bacterium]|nr:dihydrodipicolinate reductase [Chloroflexota bacterium]MCL5075672.1 dihydrodipicolinate reductase [Chloroflexota bacterium]
MATTAIQYGVGPIGSAIIELALQRGIEFTGAIDIDPQKAGRDLGDVAGLDWRLGIKVSGDAEAVLKASKADIVFHSTGSYLHQTLPQLRQVLQAGMNVISTCEEMAYPKAQHPDIAEELGQMAKQNGVSILGTGINPGFLMDALPIFLSGVCREVRRIWVRRIVDASLRRLPLQKKIGAGLSVAQFQRRVAERAVRHVGLRESMMMVADALGWPLDEVKETVEPVIAEKVVRSQYIEVPPGHALGVKQIGQGLTKGEERIRLELQMYLGATSPQDSIFIMGAPDVDMTIKGGVHGDLATAAVVLNAVPQVIAAPAGLLTMLDIPPIHAWPRRSA